MRLNKLFSILLLLFTVLKADYLVYGYISTVSSLYADMFEIQLIGNTGCEDMTAFQITYNGYWSKRVPETWSGKVYAKRSGYVVTPDVRSASIDNCENINFTAQDTMPPKLFFADIFENDTLHHSYYSRDSITNTFYLDVPDTVRITIYDNSLRLHSIILKLTYDGSVWETINHLPYLGETYYVSDTSRANFDVKWLIIPEKVTSSFQVMAIGTDSSDNKDTIYSQILSVLDIVKPTLNLTSPVGNEIWDVGSSQNITWSATDNDTIISRDIYVSWNGGTNYSLLNSSNTNTGTWNWTPTKVSDQCRIKIIVHDRSNSTIKESALFTVQDTVKPTVTLSSPNGGESWLTGSAHVIYWSASDNVGLFNQAVYISYDNGSDWSLLDSGLYSSVYNWRLSDDVSQECLVKVTVIDSSGNLCSDVSNAVFSIIPPAPNTVVLLNPPDGAVNVSIQTTFQWNKISTATEYEIQVSSDNYNSYKVNQTVTDTFFTKTMTYNTDYKWKVRAINTGGEGPWSEASFKVIERDPQAAPVVINPLNNEERVSLNTLLLWHPVANADSYYIQFSSLTDQKVIFEKIIPDTSYQLSNLKKNTLYYWVLRAKNDGGISSYSSASRFTTIGTPGAITVLTPGDGEILAQDSAEIRWNNTEFCDSFHLVLRRHYDSKAICDTFLTDTSLVLKNLDNALYDVSINSVNETGNGVVNFFQFVINRPVTSILNKPVFQINKAHKFGITLIAESNVLINIFDMRGRQKTIINKILPAGHHIIETKSVSAGNYIMIIKIEDFYKKIKISAGF